ncbi:hypothetical protein INF35_05635 [Subdoligranulum sp. DSM 109015]|uniref:Phage tail protein n=1 Tax=Gemmiger gallinarum TaxID=2779354 RepID=A0ABR9R279_9FIRM|nr:hypothetical protein [Gemmiger gallinarum]MBE5037262.1 hypothetical protein [Gemmiger gallinarum]
MADERSKSWEFGDKLYLIDGKQLVVYDGESVKAVEGYIPLLTIAKAPNGGGTDYEALNLLQPKFRERFAGTDTDKAYHLSFSGLDSTAVTAKILNSSGDWVSKTENKDFTVNRSTGVVTFNSAPGKSPVTGEDNVEITASRTVEGYADRINKCTIGILFGVNGASDRLFLSGNPDFVNYDWYSGQDDPTYFPDTGYSVVGTSKSAIVGYSIINNYLATHKDDMEVDRNVIIRAGNLVDSEPAFPITNTLQGPGAIAKHSFAYLGTEPMFLTRLGIYAITPSDINGERYSQDRSYYCNGRLLQEIGLEDAFACTYKDLYWLCLNGVAYILDGLQSLGTAASEPYSNRQYACFYRTNIPARVMWVEDGRLYFGATDGRVCEFYDDPDYIGSYNDDGEPICAVWETPDLSGKYFYRNKTWRYLALQLSSAAVTGVKIFAQKRGIWTLLKDEQVKARYFSFAQVVFSKLTFSNDTTAHTLPVKTRIKKVDKTRIRLENAALNEPFGLMQIALEFVESGKYKG